jgi:hypothetical protein
MSLCLILLLTHACRCVFAGETGKSVSQYSGEWLKTVPIVRNTIKGTKGLSDSDVLVSGLHPFAVVAKAVPAGTAAG